MKDQGFLRDILFMEQILRNNLLDLDYLLFLSLLFNVYKNQKHMTLLEALFIRYISYYQRSCFKDHVVKIYILLFHIVNVYQACMT